VAGHARWKPVNVEDLKVGMTFDLSRLTMLPPRRVCLRVPVERDHGFRWKMITQSGGT
jgi:hypothetical protein